MNEIGKEVGCAEGVAAPVVTEIDHEIFNLQSVDLCERIIDKIVEFLGILVINEASDGEYRCMAMLQDFEIECEVQRIVLGRVDLRLGILDPFEIDGFTHERTRFALTGNAVDKTELVREAELKPIEKTWSLVDPVQLPGIHVAIGGDIGF
jgi:hypothetical protein